MPQKTLRSVLQIAFLLFVLLAVAADNPAASNGCCQCDEDGGTDNKVETETSSGGALSSAIQSGRVERYHDFSTSDTTLRGKDLAYIKEWLPGNVIIGLHIPTAPGASQPGSLADEDHELVARVAGSGPSYQVPLVSDTDMADCISDIFPPDAGAHWEALVPANDEYLDWIPEDTTAFEDFQGWLKYVLDFHGASFCNGCTIKLTYCTPTDSLPEDLLARHPLLRLALNDLEWHNDGCLTCTDPIPTVIRLTDYQGNPLPSSPAAWLSAWGGPVLTGTYGPQVEKWYTLGHSLQETKTFNLEPIQSEKGWMYDWYDTSGNPITQLEVVPSTSTWDEPQNVVVRGTVPTNTQEFDTIHLTATCASDPSLQAEATSIVGAFPDPTQNTVADVGITKTANAQTIAAGESVEYTLTVSNYEESPIHVIITDTLTPAWIISDVTLPQGCERNGGQIVCEVLNVPAGGSTNLRYTVHTANWLGATLSNQAEAQPRDGVDFRFYDNQAGPVEVIVEGEGSTLYLPFISKP